MNIPFKYSLLVHSCVPMGVATETIQLTQYPRSCKHYYTNMPGSHTTYIVVAMGTRNVHRQ